MSRARRVVVLVAASLLVTSACSGDGKKSSDPELTTTFSSYVAMGDSAVAGPNIAPNDRKSGRCARSKANWPALLADAVTSSKVRDVSCSGAISSDITKERAHPAQIDALSAKTDLVTISIGGNDEGLFSKIILNCLFGPYNATACESFVDTQLDGIVARTTDRVASTLHDIKESAPNARVVMVGYLRILPEADGCEVRDLSAARVTQAVTAMNAMSGAIQSAAARAEVEFVSLDEVSLGHEACAGSDAWVNGMKSVPGDGAQLHPNSSGMHAVARTVADQLTD